ncbi:hypothetical protein Pst134EB_012415 [Puccinia striiformis f. sp. tritici]|nr:hypothetical protein Pst134EB_012415 [Puccinia striiformis f. sp. tritici]
MRHLTQRKQLTQAATYSAMVMMLDSDCDSDLEDYYQLCRYQLQKRYLTSRNTATRFHPRYDLSAMQSLADSTFLQIFRMTWPCFLNLLHLIEKDPIFYNSSQNPQRDPLVQLAVATCRLGSNGNGAAVTQLKTLFNIGYGTINLYTMRFIKIIYKKKSLLASWPTQEERLEMSQVMQDEGFPGCVGFVDGTTIPLSQKPPVDGNHYFDRKKRSDIVLNFPDSRKELLESQNVDFNYRLAQSRVRIEHAIGILKGRFSSLCEIRCQLRTRNKMKGTIKWIITCIVLHNLLADLKDQWNDLYEDETPDPPPDIDDDDSNHGDDGLRGVLRSVTLAHFE